MDRMVNEDPEFGRDWNLDNNSLDAEHIYQQAIV
jgi:hypothetical protein